MKPRLHVPLVPGFGAGFELPPAQSRHVQVLRLQPGDALTLFDGRGGEWAARVATIGRSAVGVDVESHRAIDREPARAVALVLGMPANERMDALVEKATELGAASLQPLVCERSVLRLAGERATKRVAHWQAVAVAASEQSGRTRVPPVHAVRTLADWLDAQRAGASNGATRIVLQPDAAVGWRDAPAAAGTGPIVVLSGPEGGLAPSEIDAARAAGFAAVSLGARVLRADTAPLAVLAWCALDDLRTAASA